MGIATYIALELTVQHNASCYNSGKGHSALLFLMPDQFTA